MEKTETPELKNELEKSEKKELNKTEENNTETSKETIGYSKKSFWDERFSQEDGNFDWYVDWEQLKPKLKNLIKENDKILNVGCGNSKLAFQMSKDNYLNIINIDISGVVIEKMKKLYPNLNYIEMDATHMTFNSNDFDCVIDKGTLDAIMCGGDPNPPFDLINEMYRVTKINGYCFFITHGNPNSRLDYFKKCIGDDEKFEINYEVLNLNFMANLINSLRNSSKDHSIKNGMSDKNVLIASILDAFVNTYKKSNLSPEEIKENKKIELSLKLQAVLAKFNGDKDKMKKELGKNPIDFKKMENDSDDNGNMRKKHCYLYIVKKLQ